MAQVSLEATRLKADGRRSEAESWDSWMRSAAVLATRFYNEARQDDPFAYGETASVGFLATAAAHAGYMALPEFAVPKTDQTDRRRSARGRNDLWVSDGPRDWWFEAKQLFINRGSDADLKRAWDAADRCAQAVQKQGTAVAMLIVSCWRLKGRKAPAKSATNRPIETTRKASRDAIARLSRSTQFCWRIGPEDDELPETYLLMSILKDR